MKVKANVKFRDKHTGKIIKKDHVMEISKERYEEICKTNDKLVSVVVESEENVEADATTKKTRGRKSK